MPSREQCVRLGEKVGRVNVACESCGGVNVTRNVRACEVHSRCIPNFNPTGGLLEEWRTKSGGVVLCAECPDKLPPASPAE